MTTLLLVVIYIAFIGLGLPDSLFGTAWPAIYAEWNLPVSLASVVSFISCFGTLISACSAHGSSTVSARAGLLQYVR